MTKWKLVRALGDDDAKSVRTELCEDERGERAVIKTLSVRTTDEETLRLFEREAQVLRSLKHVQIPSYLDAWQEGVDGELELRIAQRFVKGHSPVVGQPQTVDSLRDLAEQLATVLAYLHEFSPPVVHRDLKPSNIIVDDEGLVHLVDFGAVTAPSSRGETVVGTYGYMPPEQYEGRASPASDVYALGMLLLSLATGREPWEHDEDPRDAFARTALPIDLKKVIQQFVARDPKARPQDGAAALELLLQPMEDTQPQTRGAALAILVVVGLFMFAISLVFWLIGGASAPDLETQSVTALVVESRADPGRAMSAEAVHCVSRFARILEARDRYESWVSEGGPTCEEKHIYGTYEMYDDTASVCEAASRSARAHGDRWGKAAPSLALMGIVARRAQEPLTRASRYYNDHRFIDDKCALGQTLHGELRVVFLDAARAMREVLHHMDEIKTPSAPELYRALGAVAAAAPMFDDDETDELALRDAFRRAVAAHDELAGEVLPTNPAALGLYRSRLANADLAMRALRRHMEQLEGDKKKARGFDPTGIRRDVYRAVHVGLQIPAP